MAKILVAEDSFALANLLNFVLSNAGFEVELHRHGASALASCQRHQFDLILLDHQMPHVSGLEIIEQIRGAGPNQQTPAFLCTAKSHELRLAEYSQSLNISGVFHKPFSPRDLVSRLQAFVQPSVVN
jgi:CheY-like chemotaxis protein